MDSASDSVPIQTTSHCHCSALISEKNCAALRTTPTMTAYLYPMRRTSPNAQNRIPIRKVSNAA
jgi:hypothetical protein